MEVTDAMEAIGHHLRNAKSLNLDSRIHPGEVGGAKTHFRIGSEHSAAGRSPQIRVCVYTRTMSEGFLNPSGMSLLFNYT